MIRTVNLPSAQPKKSLTSTLKSVPLGVPLTLVSVGLVASLAFNKKLHVGLGVVWGVLSLLHGVQHARKLKQDVRKLIA